MGKLSLCRTLFYLPYSIVVRVNRVRGSAFFTALPNHAPSRLASTNKRTRRVMNKTKSKMNVKRPHTGHGRRKARKEEGGVLIGV
jgi:hypothetical protein